VRTETEEIFIRPKHRTGPRHTVSQHWRLEHVIYRTLYEPSADTNEDSSLDQNRFGKHDPNRLDKSAQWLDQQQTPTGSIVFIETLLVADNSMLQGYGYDGLFGYVLSRMNEVNWIISDAYGLLETRFCSLCCRLQLYLEAIAFLLIFNW
jgi:hypothetical protein